MAQPSRQGHMAQDLSSLSSGLRRSLFASKGHAAGLPSSQAARASWRRTVLHGGASLSAGLASQSRRLMASLLEAEAGLAQQGEPSGASPWIWNSFACTWPDRSLGRSKRQEGTFPPPSCLSSSGAEGRSACPQISCSPRPAASIPADRRLFRCIRLG